MLTERQQHARLRTRPGPRDPSSGRGRGGTSTRRRLGVRHRARPGSAALPRWCRGSALGRADPLTAAWRTRRQRTAPDPVMDSGAVRCRPGVNLEGEILPAGQLDYLMVLPSRIAYHWRAIEAKVSTSSAGRLSRSAAFDAFHQAFPYLPAVCRLAWPLAGGRSVKPSGGVLRARPDVGSPAARRAMFNHECWSRSPCSARRSALR